MTDAPTPTGKTPTGKVGNLTRDPELRFSQRGTAFAMFGLAVTPYVPKDDPQPETVFYEVVCFGSLAEHAAESLTKGDRVVVVGIGELEHWTGRDGQERTTRKIIAEGVGPDLRFTTAQVVRTDRQKPATAAPVAASTGDGYGYQDEPF